MPRRVCAVLNYFIPTPKRKQVYGPMDVVLCSSPVTVEGIFFSSYFCNFSIRVPPLPLISRVNIKIRIGNGSKKYSRPIKVKGKVVPVLNYLIIIP
jgi:hypothetical protein